MKNSTFAEHPSDLIIAYVYNIAYNQGRTTSYQMHLGKTGLMIRFDALFDRRLLAHLVGHVLGAGHNPDPSNYRTPSVKGPSFIITPFRIVRHLSTE